MPINKLINKISMELIEAQGQHAEFGADTFQFRDAVRALSESVALLSHIAEGGQL
jgi:hypothetical protein